ncbi:hypothetical protein IKQ_05210 [Bacillus cereus VDM053]|nr:hypothetical protein IKQ_05210 [Bacillus cereus VDM053]
MIIICTFPMNEHFIKNLQFIILKYIIKYQLRSHLIPNHSESDEFTLYRKVIIIVFRNMRLANEFR